MSGTLVGAGVGLFALTPTAVVGVDRQMKYAAVPPPSSKTVRTTAPIINSELLFAFGGIETTNGAAALS